VRPFKPEDVATCPAVIGCDEVGRGALCGPVVVGAVWFDPRQFPLDVFVELDDSKRLSRAEREVLAGLIRGGARVALAASSAALIDQRGIRAATLDAMRRAVLRLGIDAPVLVDGLDVPPNLSLPARAVVRGDSRVPQIAAASIVAKTCRDHLMVRLAARYPGYGWERNVGYGTPEHRDAIARVGVTPHHRRSFRPVSEHWLCTGNQGGVLYSLP